MVLFFHTIFSDPAALSLEQLVFLRQVAVTQCVVFCEQRPIFPLLTCRGKKKKINLSPESKAFIHTVYELT